MSRSAQIPSQLGRQNCPVPLEQPVPKVKTVREEVESIGGCSDQDLQRQLDQLRSRNPAMKAWRLTRMSTGTGNEWALSDSGATHAFLEPAGQRLRGETGRWPLGPYADDISRSDGVIARRH